MFDLITFNLQVFTAALRHFGMYWYNYITLFGLPILYNKITYNYGWTKLPIFSIKFLNLYILTFLLLVLVSILAFVIQKFAIQRNNKQQLEWKSNWYRLFFYTMPVGLGLCVLISFKLLWYEGEDLYPILMAYAKSRFLIYLLVFIMFTIWLDRDPQRNWYIAYLSNGVPQNDRQEDHIQVDVNHGFDKKPFTTDLTLNNVSYNFENRVNSILNQKLIKHDPNEMKTLVKQAIVEYVESSQSQLKSELGQDTILHLKVIVKEVIEEYIESNPIAVKYEFEQDMILPLKVIVKEAIEEYVERNQLHLKNELDQGTMLPFKVMMKEVIQEVVKNSHKSLLENDMGRIPALPWNRSKVESMDLIKNDLENLNAIPLEDLYGKLYANSKTQLQPNYGPGATIFFFHLFAIETHSKHAIVILTNGTQVRSDKIFDFLENMGLIGWMIKVNKFHFINAMHICFMNYRDGNLVRIQDLTSKSIQQKLDKKQVLEICFLGTKIKDTKIKEFLESRAERSNESWNAFVRLK